MPNQSDHGLLLAQLIQRVQDYLEKNPVGRCYVKTGCILSDKQVVYPDVSILLNDHLNKADGLITGAPDWIGEVLDEDDNPFAVSNLLQLYRQAGVKEIWLVSPQRHAIWVGNLREKGWEARPRHNGTIESRVLKGFTLQINKLFPETKVA